MIQAIDRVLHIVDVGALTSGIFGTDGTEVHGGFSRHDRLRGRRCGWIRVSCDVPAPARFREPRNFGRPQDERAESLESVAALPQLKDDSLLHSWRSMGSPRHSAQSAHNDANERQTCHSEIMRPSDPYTAVQRSAPEAHYN